MRLNLRVLRLDLVSDPDTVTFNQQKFALEIAHLTVQREVVSQPCQEMWKHLWVVSDLKRDDAVVIGWWVREYVSKITV